MKIIAERNIVRCDEAKTAKYQDEWQKLEVSNDTISMRRWWNEQYGAQEKKNGNLC